VSSTALRCYQLASGNEGATTLPIEAGSTFTFKLDTNIGHPGPLAFYMAKAPSGTSASNFDGSGNVWFKIWQEQPTFTSTAMVWASQGKTEVSVKIPTCIPDGDYLLRVEHLALHSASSEGGAQFYIGCAQVAVSGGTGSAVPSGVALPGAYKATDPGEFGCFGNAYDNVTGNFSNTPLKAS